MALAPTSSSASQPPVSWPVPDPITPCATISFHLDLPPTDDRDSSFRVGYLSRKALPIKRQDAEPLTRSDVQYDLLNFLFTDDHAVFTDPAGPSKPKLTFSDLYVHALYNSTKCSKVLKEKMLETPAFAIEFAKISLLTNIGRINTTMAFFPEMKTALRTYHPVPSLQKTDGNAQDAPRIKNCLKAALLSHEFKSVPPSTPDEVIQKRRSGQRPPTSVVNLVFVLAYHAAPLASVHFDGNINFLDLFLPKPISSQTRARAFLWHLYHYLEDDQGPNPFRDDYSTKNPGKAPILQFLTQDQHRRENVDTSEELDFGARMSNHRNRFLQQLVTTMEQEKRNKGTFIAVSPPEMVYPGTRARPQRLSTVELSNTSGPPSLSAREDREREFSLASRISTPDSSSTSGPQHRPPSSSGNITAGGVISVSTSTRPSNTAAASSRQTDFLSHKHGRFNSTNSTPTNIINTGGSSAHSHPHYPHQNHQNRTHRSSHSFSHLTIQDSDMADIASVPSPLSPVTPGGLRRGPSRGGAGTNGYRSPTAASSDGSERTMLQQTFQLVMTTDPLMDSDDELADENVSHLRLDYERRLNVISRIMGQPASPS